MRIRWMIGIVFMCMNCAYGENDVQVSMEDVQVSMISVIANPGDYDQKDVTVTGWLETFGPRKYVLFFSEEHAEYMDTGNAIPVEDKWITEAGFSLDYCPFGYVAITGSISIENGHPTLTNLFNAAFFHEEKGVVGRVGCREDLGMRAQEFFED